jgi:hypothetical protein
MRRMNGFVIGFNLGESVVINCTSLNISEGEKKED